MEYTLKQAVSVVIKCGKEYKKRLELDKVNFPVKIAEKVCLSEKK